ncbi:MAG: hypothetical protein PVH52_06780 [bacterium]|jgi:hypothetical protein
MRYIKSILVLVIVACSLAGLDSCSDSNCVDPCREELLSDPTTYLPLAVGNWWKYGGTTADGQLHVLTDSVVSYEPLPFGGMCYQMSRRRFEYDTELDSVVVDTLYHKREGYEVRGNAIYKWIWHYGIDTGDTVAWRILDAPLELGKEWEVCDPREYVYQSAPTETLRIRCSGREVYVKYSTSVTGPAGTFPRVYEIWNSYDGNLWWEYALAPGVGPPSSIGVYYLVDYHVSR